MTNQEKFKISEKLAEYCGMYDSQNKAANSLKNVSPATVSHMLKGAKQYGESPETPEAWAKIKAEMWRNVAAQVGCKNDEWVVAETRDFKTLYKLLAYSKENSKVSFITGATGSGKTETIKKFTKENKQVYTLKCNDFWNRKTFLFELLTAIGEDASGYTMYELMGVIVRKLKEQEAPLLVLDEADKLNDQLLYFFITLYNNLEDHCGIIMIATEFLEKRIKKGIRLGKKGYPEIYSRGGKKFIKLNGVGSTDVRAVCVANGITEASRIKEIYEDSDHDLRRVKDKIKAYKKLVQGQEA
ncbi:ATP-binding protein [uncultured Draconibacterium sp.]|uniref:ATP-binding protein n=1 Tax=uncultured Draconibacterium sp. TaxID=1573823 RepID=UPI0025EA335A|nr:ATP-binding protein [uncultured Draconibacterium sp.]